jgi:hypothetical protein
MKKLLALPALVLLLLGFYLYLLYSLGGKITLATALAQQPLALLTAVAAASLLLWGVYYGLLSRLRWRFYPGLRFAVSWALLWVAGIGAAWAGSRLLAGTISQTGLYGTENEQIFLLTGAIVALLLSLLFTLSDFSWYAYYRYAAETLARLRAQRRQTELQFDVLRDQLTPHYLFNSLNTASNLISYDPGGAEQYLRQLALNIHYLLGQPQEVLSPLQRELEVVDSFFHLMQVRYGERIQLEKSIEKGCLDQKVPTLALQMLVENAIKHNVATDDAPVRIRITAAGKGVLVENNITRPPQGVHSGKVGLLNLQERYRHLSRHQPEVQQQEGHFRVRLPYITEIRKEAYV